MTDLATDLKKMLDATMFDRLEAYRVLPDGKVLERSDEDESAIEIFKVLLAAVDAIRIAGQGGRRTSCRRAAEVQRYVVARSGISRLRIFAIQRG
jgi:hypothetical protein